MLHGKEKAWFNFREVADEICKKYELSVIENPDRNRPPNFIIMQDRQTTKEKAGIPTRYNLARAAIDEAIENSRTMNDFKRYLSSMGYQYKISPNLKYWTVIPAGYKQSIRIYQLGENYTNIRIQERIQKNDLFIRIKPFQPEKYMPNKQYDIRKTKGSLYNLYLYYCYRLGYFDKSKDKKNMRDYNRLHYLLRDDLMQVDKYSQESELLGKNHIDTTEQLFSYKQTLIDEMAKLADELKCLKNKVKRKSTTQVERSEAKNEISIINEKRKQLRKEISLCDDIANRSHTIKNNLEQIIADDEKQNFKDKEEKANDKFK
jgi:hypothetical protein